MGGNGFHLSAFQKRTGQKTARTDKCLASSAVLLPSALEYGLSSFCHYRIHLVGCIRQNLTCLPSCFPEQNRTLQCIFFSGGSGHEGWTHSHAMAALYIFSVLMFQHWSHIFAFLTAETRVNVMFSIYEPLPVMSVIYCSVLLAKQEALGFLQPHWSVKCGSLLAFLPRCQVGSAIIYWQSCCWQEWCLFGS